MPLVNEVSREERMSWVGKSKCLKCFEERGGKKVV